jgi:hypothetical protein
MTEVSYGSYARSTVESELATHPLNPELIMTAVWLAKLIRLKKCLG